MWRCSSASAPHGCATFLNRRKQQAPCIIFIDELDALGKAAQRWSRWAEHEEREQTLNQLLVEMDGFDSRKGVIIMAATNRPEILDPALLRPGRFDRQVLVDRPDIRGREAILKVHVQAHQACQRRGYASMLRGTTTGLCRRRPGQRGERGRPAGGTPQGKSAVEMDDFEEAINRLIAGLEKKQPGNEPKRSRKSLPTMRSGHALVAESLPQDRPGAQASPLFRGV